MGLFSRFFRRRSVEGITGPTRVDLPADVVSEDGVESPLTGVRCALAQWVLVTVTSLGGGRTGGRSVVLRPIASGFFGETLTLGTPHGDIEVPLEGLRFVGVVDPEDALVIERPLPADLARLVERTDLTGGREVRFREAYLRRHDRVRLRAVVEPRASEGGAYRGAPRAAFRVRHDLGEARLVDLGARAG